MISVILPSYNSEQTIKMCLSALLNQSFRGAYEIILVDSSVDSTPQIVEDEFPSIRFVHLDKKTDPGTARNIGINMAEGKLIAFIDSDCIAAQNWLEKIAEAHELTPYNIVGGVVHNGNPQGDLVGLAGYISEFREFLPGSAKQIMKHIPTCNLSYKKQVFQKFGQFEGKYYPQEDLVFNNKLCKSGEKILLDPDIQVYHHHRSVVEDFVKHQNRIGAITSSVLKRIDMEGSFIARRPIVAVLMFPFLPVVKFFRTIAVFLKYQPGVLLENPLVLVLFICGLIAWNVGFLRGVIKTEDTGHR